MWFGGVLGGPGGGESGLPGPPPGPPGPARNFICLRGGVGDHSGALPLLRINRALGSAELKGPRKLLRIRPKIIDLGPKSAPKPDEAKPKMPGSVPTNRHKPIPIDFGPVSGCFDHDPKLLNCEIAQPSQRGPT